MLCNKNVKAFSILQEKALIYVVVEIKRNDNNNKKVINFLFKSFHYFT